ncbi:SRPBCC domain-containing protein [Paenibacillus mesophilus]|uniref:SRPBCC family protein n=1 Tax=Paenibacillus mesophilus TaxID=2582849 RepID=UPI00110D5C65|nr:SRPBCC domain-containing protein [Paenibacillus mesophilus]TMV46808.1 SRPBCC domain-containing protein [Paenibacillus mesophilus]
MSEFDTTNGLVITRVFNAPRELVFKAWTEPERLAQWWGPKGFALEISKLDLRPGGMFLGSQRSPEGFVMWGKFVYQEITPPEKLVFIQSFSDEEGNTVRAPFSPVWPLEIINELTLTEHEGKTTLTLRGGPINATEDELKAFEGMKPMVQQGFVGTFDQLEAFLAQS